MRFFRGRSRAPLSIAAVIALPLFFSSLMSATLALEKPFKIEWIRADHIVATWHDPTTSNIVHIWLWACVPPLLLILVGLLAIRIPFGFYVSCAAGVVIAMATVHKTAIWAVHHTLRYPNGVDLIPAGSAYAGSNRYDPGQWEKQALATALSLEHWTIGVALAAALVMGIIQLRRRLGRVAAPAPPPLEGIHAPDATTPSV
ncbi:MAG TPA: hypothetical protein VGH82_14325 [Gaiellaceae bacterium]|jgi:hypothetical protein